MDGYRSIGSACFALAAALVVTAGFFAVKQLDWGRKARRVTGEVVGFREHHLRTGEPCRVAQVRYLGDGARPETMTSGLCVNVGLYHLGQLVPVLYQPGPTGGVALDLPWERWRLASLSLLLALGPLVVGGLFFRAARREDRRLRDVAEAC